MYIVHDIKNDRLSIITVLLRLFNTCQIFIILPM